MKTNHCVAIFGGAVAGSEAASVLVNQGINVVVFEQNILPYGKIETGLPKWHVKLRDRQEEKIDAKLNHPLVQYVPSCCLGENVIFEDVCKNWGFSAVLIATGAWQDRPLPVEGVDEFVGNGLVYQNPFVQWFNQCHDPGYFGEVFEIKDNAVVVGGGLASIDVVKILMIETFCNAVREKGLETDTLSVERLGLKTAAQQLGLSMDDLNLKGCTLYYRRRVIDMPLSPVAGRPTEEEWQKIYHVRKKIIKLAQDKYCFHMRECHMPASYKSKNGKLESIVFQRTKIEGGRVVPLPDDFVEVKSDLFISSIGSVPQKLPGVPYMGERFALADEESGRFDGYDHVFALGNAVTGKGNIKESQYHANSIANVLVERYFKPALHESDGASSPDASVFTGIMNKVKELQLKAGYNGNYSEWVAKHRPVRLESMLEAH